MSTNLVRMYTTGRQRLMASLEEGDRGNELLAVVIIAAAVVTIGALVVAGLTGAINTRLGQIK